MFKIKLVIEVLFPRIKIEVKKPNILLYLDKTILINCILFSPVIFVLKMEMQEKPLSYCYRLIKISV